MRKSIIAGLALGLACLIPGRPASAVSVALKLPRARPVQIKTDVGFIHGVIRGRGSSAALVIPGGPGSDSNYLDPLHQGLAEELPNTRWVKIDPRGVGKSSRTTKRQNNFVGNVNDIEAARKKLGVEKLHLFGESFGAAIAVGYAARYPDRVASLVLMGPVAHNKELYEKTSNAFDAHVAKLVQEGVIPQAPPNEDVNGENDRTAPAYFAPGFPVPKEWLSKYSAFVPEVYSDLNSNFLSYGIAKFAPLLPRIKVPTLIVAGTQDRIGMPAATARTLPGVKAEGKSVVMIPDAGHVPYFEKRELTLGYLGNFYRDLGLR